MKNCVHTNSKEFKDCCKRLNVSSTTLEPIIHEYINTEGNENSFPSDHYIEKRIHGEETSVLSDEQIQLWEKKYSQPQVFESIDIANDYYEECNKFFPKEAIGFKETADGKYEIRVSEPYILEELESIRKQAIKDGKIVLKEDGSFDYALAPNGKRSNLTEQQWLQVRTKAFKRWFGDWERFDKANPYSSKIFVTDVSPDYDSADAEGPGAMFAIFEGDKYVGSIAINANYKGKNSFKTWGEKGTNYVSMSSVGDAVEIEEKFRGKGYGKAAYFEFAKQMANMGYVLRSAPANSRTEDSTRVWKSLVRDGYAKKVDDRYEFINYSLNNASKIVDENGEPLVVYHGTDAEFNTFDISFFGKTDPGDSGKGFYFSLTESGYGGIDNYNIAVFLNIKNPYMVDKFSSENSLSGIYKAEVFNRTKEELIQEYTKLVEDNYTKGTPEYEEALENLKKVPNILNSISDEEYNEIQKHDGVTAYNTDVKRIIEYVVKDPNQIKSAERNIGTFSTTKDDIFLQKYKKYDYAKEAQKETLRQHYQSEALNKAKKRIDFANQLKNTYKKTVVRINPVEGGDIVAKTEVLEILNKIKEALGDVVDRVYPIYLNDKKNGERFEVRINLKSLNDLENIEISKINKYVDSLSDEALLSEVTRIENERLYDDDLAFHIKSKEIPIVREQLQKKNPYLTEEEIDETIDFLVSLENNPETNLYVQTVLKWVKNKTIQLPRDNDAILDIFESARKLKLNVQKYYSPFDIVPDIIEAQGGKIKYEEGVDPYKIPEFRYVRSVTSADGKQLDIFDVEDTLDGAQAVSQVLADTTPKNALGELATGSFSSPWCLATFKYKKDTKKAQREEGANHNWFLRYNKGKRQIAFCNGYPVAFNSSDQARDVWWDYIDQPHLTIEEVSTEPRETRLKQYIEDDNSHKTIEVSSGCLIDYMEGKAHYISQQGIYYVVGGDSHRSIHLNSFISTLSPWMSRYEVTPIIDNDKIIIEIYPKKKGSIHRITPIILTLSEKDVKKLKDLYSIYEESVTKVNELSKFIYENFLSKFKFAPDSLIKTRNEEYDALYNKLRNIHNYVKTIVTKAIKDAEYKLSQEKKKPQSITSTSAEILLRNLENANKESLKSSTTKSEENTHVNRMSITDELDYMTEDELNDTAYTVNKHSATRKFGAKLIQRLLQAIKDRDLKKSYNEGLRKEVNSDLEHKLTNILKEYHFETLEASLKEVFGEDVLGATDFLNKVVYLANEGDRNALTGIEEFSHAFVKLMGSVYHKEENRHNFPETAIYSEIRDLIEQTSLYTQVLELYKDNPQYQYDNGTPNYAKIKEEAVGQALAVVLLERYESKNKKDLTFFDKVKEWFKEVLKTFKAIFVDSTKLDIELEKIADSILDGTYHKKYLQKIPNKEVKKYRIQDFKETVENSVKEDGGVALSILQDSVATGGYVTGSLSYRKQSPVYRKKQDTLHDIDIVYPLSSHNWHSIHPYWRATKKVSEDRQLSNDQLIQNVKNIPAINSLLERQPNMQIMWVYPDYDNNVVVNAIVCEDTALIEKFKNLKGNYTKRLNTLTKKERQQIHLVDIFLHKTDDVSKDIITEEDFNLKLTNYRHSFKAKLKYARAKDLFDYQMLDPGEYRKYLIDKTNTVQNPVMLQINPNTTQELIEETDSAQAISNKTQFNLTSNTKLQEYQQSAEFYSGAADGADTEWTNSAKEHGIKVTEYTPKEYNDLSKEKKDKIEQEYQEAREFLGRPNLTGYSGELVRRDMMQADSADAIFGVVKKVVKPGEKDGNYTNKTNHENVAGGTAYAVARGILRGIPVYIFDQSDNQWKVWNKDSKSFVVTQEPILTPHAATIGTRGINDAGKKAIKDIFKKTFEKQTTSQTSQQTQQTINQEVDESDLTQKEIDAKNAAREKELSLKRQYSIRLSEQVKNLINSDTTTESEYNKIATDLAFDISDTITKWQENPNQMYKDLEEIRPFSEEEKKSKDVSKLSRKELLEYVGVSNLLTYIKEDRFGNTSDDIDIEKALVFYENFEALIRFGSNTFNTLEDFNLHYSEAGYVVSTNKDSQDTEALSNEEQSIKEECGDKQEHWQIDNRTIDNFLSMSQAVKRELLKCYILDGDGNPKKNIFGINERINPRDATSSILRWTQGSLTLEDMVRALKAKASLESNAWVNPIIEKLTDKSGKYSDFQSQFFGVFCKHFQNYYIVKETKVGKHKVLRIMNINLDPALKEVVSSIEISHKLQGHPLFDRNGIIKEKYDTLKSYISLLNKLSEGSYEEVNLDRVSNEIQKILSILGYDTSHTVIKESLTEEVLSSTLTNLNNIINNLSNNLDNRTYNPFTFSTKKDVGIRGYLTDLLKPFTDKLEDIALSSFYDNGKMYQSYITPSYLTKLINKFRDGDTAKFEHFIESEYGQYDWFRDTTSDMEVSHSWKNIWLRQLYTLRNDVKARRKLFDHKVQLSFNGHNYMRDMTGPEYILAVLTEYFSIPYDSKESATTAWYKVPMLSNKPSLEFIKFTRYRGIGFETPLLEGFLSIFNQELQRIATVNARGYKKGDPEFISNYDSNGKKFQFLDFLNSYIGGTTEVAKLLTRKIKEDNLSNAEENKLQQLIVEEIENYINNRAKTIIESYKEAGLFGIIKNIEGAGKTDREIEDNLREFVWNDTFAAMNILQLTITDIAFYKNAEDLQKRLAQIHAPGIRPNVNALDYGEVDENGNIIRPADVVCDGKLRTIFLKDVDGKAAKSNIIENLKIVFQRKIDEAPEHEKAYWKDTADSILEMFEKEINAADAQAYNSITSYRKKAIMFGKWSKESEALYQKILNNDFNISDLQTAFQPLKPFVYTNTTKDSGVGSKIKVGMQFKNSEYLLVMAGAILQNEDTGIPNYLRVISKIMENSALKDRKKGIDTVQFASAVKAGLHGEIDLLSYASEEEAIAEIEKLIGDSSSGYNQTYVHEYPAEDYIIQQEVPKHFMEHSQAHGSQERYIIPSDLATVDKDGKEVLFTYKDGDKEVSQNAEDFKREYEKTIAENIEESIELLTLELSLSGNKLQRNTALSSILQEEILSNPRYSMDLYFACAVDENGEFNIPLGDPIQAKRIEQLINSVVKNRINKQKIAGGPVVQVSNFGMSKRLNIKFKDKKGNVLPTLTEWLNLPENKNKTAKDYKEELSDKQAGVAYYECFAPAYMQEFLSSFMNERGEIDVKAVEKINPEMLDMVGYRIPTEDAYSIAPLKIVGFLPKEAGEGIVLPYEITLITGSDRIVVSTSII